MKKEKATMAEEPNAQPMIDERVRLKKLNEATRAVYIGEHKGNYDPSVFVEAIQRANGERILYVPAGKRMKWFHADHPTGVVAVDKPVIESFGSLGRQVTVTAAVYLTAEDYQNKTPAATNSASRPLYPNDVYGVDICVTRAQSRVLRDIGYDIPGDAHEIEGWTPVTFEANDTVKTPEDALESSVSVRPTIPPVRDQQKQSAAAAKAKAKAPADKAADSTAPAPAASDSDSAPNKAEKAPASAEPTAEPASTVPAAAENAPAPKQDAAPVPPTAPSAPAAEAPKPMTIKEMLEMGEKVLQIPAEDYMSATNMYQGRLGDQSEKRIRFYVDRGLKGALSDAVVGYAAAIVAKNCGLLTEDGFVS